MTNPVRPRHHLRDPAQYRTYLAAAKMLTLAQVPFEHTSEHRVRLSARDGTERDYDLWNRTIRRVGETGKFRRGGGMATVLREDLGVARPLANAAINSPALHHHDNWFAYLDRVPEWIVERLGPGVIDELRAVQHTPSPPTLGVPTDLPPIEADGVAVSWEPDQFRVRTPYSPEFNASIKAAGARWDSVDRTWVVAEGLAPLVRAALYDVFGHTAPFPAPGTVAAPPPVPAPPATPPSYPGTTDEFGLFRVSGLRVSANSETVTITVPYDPDFNAAVRTMGGRWDREKRRWKCPAGRAPEIREALRAYFGHTAPFFAVSAQERTYLARARAHSPELYAAAVTADRAGAAAVLDELDESLDGLAENPWLRGFSSDTSIVRRAFESYHRDPTVRR